LAEKPQVQGFTIDQFYRFCDEGKLMAARCRKCRKLIMPPRPLCPNCYSDNLEWTQLRGEGKVVTYTIIHISTSELQPLTPYAVAVVKLEEGVSLTGMMRIGKPDEIKIGSKVSVSFEKVERKKWPIRPRIVFKAAQ